MLCFCWVKSKRLVSKQNSRLFSVLAAPPVHSECRLIADCIVDLFSLDFGPSGILGDQTLFPAGLQVPPKSCWTPELSQWVRAVSLPGMRRHQNRWVGVELVKQYSPASLSFAPSLLPPSSPSSPCGYRYWYRCWPRVGVGRRPKVWSLGSWDRPSGTWLSISTFHFVLAQAGRVSWGRDKDKPGQDVTQ